MEQLVRLLAGANVGVDTVGAWHGRREAMRALPSDVRQAVMALVQPAPVSRTARLAVSGKAYLALPARQVQHR